MPCWLVTYWCAFQLWQMDMLAAYTALTFQFSCDQRLESLERTLRSLYVAWSPVSGKSDPQSRLLGILTASKVRHAKFSRRTMHSDNAPSDLAFLQEFSESYSGFKPCDFGAAAVLFPFHNIPATSSLATRVKIEVPIHGQNDRYANLRPYSLHLGSGCR